MAADFSEKRAGNYTLIKKLGDGGFATVYLAQHTVLEKKAAVKLLLEDWIEEADVVSRFFDEARTMESVHDHPNIVKIIDIATMEKCKEEGLPPYFIMEYLEGNSLEAIMKDPNKQFSIEEIVKYMDQALSALQYCHNHGVVHRDIKPSNFMLDASGNIKLTDFGIAKAAENTSKTGEGLTLGSTDYMSPEQALGKRDLDYRSDIYSLGVTLYQIVCDKLPFIADSANAVALKHIQEKPVPPCDILGDACPRRLNNIILKAMEKEREHRFQSCDEMREELDKLLDSSIPDEEEEVLVDNKTGIRTAALDLSTLKADSDDDDYRRDDYDSTTNYTGMTKRKLATKPPAALVNSLRAILVVAVCTLFFMLVFWLYGKFTDVHLKLESSPAGASILINNSSVGTSPVELTLAPEKYLISFNLDGYELENQLLTFASGESREIHVHLKKVDMESLNKLNEAVSKINGLAKTASNLAAKTSKKDVAERERILQEASNTLNKAKDIFVSHADDFRLGLGYIQAADNLEKIEEAKGVLQSLMSTRNTGDLNCLMAIALLKQGRIDEAKDYLSKAYTMDPNSKFILNTFGQYYLDTKEPKRAKQFFDMSLFLYSDQADIKAKVEKLSSEITD